MKHTLALNKSQFKTNYFKNNYTKIFLIALATSFLVFLPFLIYDKGLFLYYGDFNVQQIPFYRLAHDAVRAGNLGWNWNTDLGANFIGSYSFYLLGSPFFWLTIPFPSDWVAFLMAPLLMLKMSCAAVTGFAFIKRFTKTQEMAMIGGLLYAFSGFSIYNIFFNHFHEAIVVFPLLLIAMEETVVNNRKGVFALAVALCAVTNYYFFFGQVVFALLYFAIRCFAPDFKINWKKFGCLALEAVLGVLLSMFLLLPSVLAILGNPRTSEFLKGFDILFYNNPQRYGLILESMFFPPDIPARPNFFPDSNAKWSSVSAFLPLFGMTGVIAYWKTGGKKWLKRLMGACLVMALIPGLNSLFSAFNWNYYARWFYMPLLMMGLATCLALERHPEGFRSGIKWQLAAVAAFGVIGILPKDDNGKLVWGQLPGYPIVFWIYMLLAAIFLLLTVLLIRHIKSVNFTRITAGILCVSVCLYSWVMITNGKTNGWSYDTIVNRLLHGEEKMTLDTDVFYRVDEDKAMDNTPMYWGLPTIQTFHSCVPPSIISFYDSIGYDRNVASRPETSYVGLRGLTSVKYLFCDVSEKDQPFIPGFEKQEAQNGFNIYKNAYFVPMGFTYDYYVTPEQFEDTIKSDRDTLMLSAIALDEKDIQKYGYLLHPISDEELPDSSDQTYFDLCEKRAASAGYEFYHDNRGFTSKIQLEQDNLVFFSVPYESGWSVTVNGEARDVVKANVGFMAVHADKGDNIIRFTYHTPGLAKGAAVSGIALLILGGYVYFWRKRAQTHPEDRVNPYAHRNERELELVNVDMLTQSYADHVKEP